MTNLSALQAAIKLLADLINDSIKAAGDSSIPAKLEDFSNIIPDIMALIPSIGSIPSEAAAMQPADYGALVSSLAADMALPEGKAANMINAGVKIISDLASIIVPDVEAFIVAANS